MNNSAVNQSLIEIEENLKNLETARNQVDNVSKKSESLLLEVTKLIDKIQILENEFSLEKSGLYKKINREVSELQKSLKNETESFIEKSKKLSIEHSNSTHSSIEKLQAFQKNLAVVEKSILELDFEKEFTEIRAPLQKVVNQHDSFLLDINKLFAGIKASIGNSLSQLQIDQKKIHETLSSNFLKSISKLESEHKNSYQKLSTSLSGSLNIIKTDQKTANDHLLQALKKQDEKLILFKKILFLMIGLGLIGILLVFFSSQIKDFVK